MDDKFDNLLSEYTPEQREEYYREVIEQGDATVREYGRRLEAAEARAEKAEGQARDYKNRWEVAAAAQRGEHSRHEDTQAQLAAAEARAAKAEGFVSMLGSWVREQYDKADSTAWGKGRKRMCTDLIDFIRTRAAVDSEGE